MATVMDQHELYLHLSVHLNNDAVRYHDLNTRYALKLYKDAFDCWSSSSKSPIYSKTMKPSDGPLLFWEVIISNPHEPLVIDEKTIKFAVGAEDTREFVYLVLLYNVSLLLNSLGETSTAFECLLAAEELARSRFNESEDSLDMGSRLHPSFSVSLHYHLGRSAYTLGEFGLAYDYQCEALSQGWYLKHESRDDHEKQRFTITLATIWTAKAWCLLEQGLLSSSQDAFKEAKELYDQSQSHEIKNAFAKLTLPAASAA